MLDRLLAGSMTFTVLTLIGTCCIGALLMSYTGIFDLVGDTPLRGSILLAGGTALGLFGWRLCRYRNDLIDC